MGRFPRHLFTLVAVLSTALFIVIAFEVVVYVAIGPAQWSQTFDAVTLWPGERLRVAIVLRSGSTGLQIVRSPDPSSMPEPARRAWRARPRTYRERRAIGFYVGAGRWEDNLSGTDRQFDVGLPTAVALPLLLIAPAAWLRRRHVDRQARRNGRCPSCGYDLRATPDRCPECGAVRQAGVSLASST
jgi:hypothetical protein